jgi:hypothetical protein
MRGFVLILAVFIFFLSFPPSPAQGTPQPANDDWTNAVDLGTGSSVLIEGTTLGATREPGEPWDTNIVGAVWYKWTPAISGGVQYDLETGTPHIRVYQPGQLPDGVIGFPWFEVARNGRSFLASAGSTYYLAVYAATEPGSFRFFARIGPPKNDDFANATEVRRAYDVVEISGSLIGATREPGEPEIPESPATVWYRWVPDFSGRLEYRLNLIESGSVPPSGAIPYFQVYRANGNSLGDLTLVSAANDRPHVVAGNTYYFAIYKSPGLFSFLVEKSPPPPVNDNFADAITLESNGHINEVGTTAGATREPFEAYNDKGLNSIWYKWKSAISMHRVVAAEFGDATVFEAKGDSIQDLVPIGKPGQTIYFTTGRTYYFAVYNNMGHSGHTTLRLGAPPRPDISDDYFSGAYPVEFGADGTGVAFISLKDAKLEENEPHPNGSVGSVWRIVTVPFPTFLTLRPSEPQVACTVFAGSALSNLTVVKPALLFPNTDYYIALNAIGVVSNAFELKLSLSPATEPFPRNDDFEDALPVTLDTTFIGGRFRHATPEPGEPQLDSLGWFPNARTLWWKLTPDRAGTLLMWPKPSGATHRFALYRGTALTNLQRIPASSMTLGQVLTPVERGETYYIQVQGGEFSLEDGVALRFDEGLDNDNFENAHGLDPFFGSLTSHNRGGTQQAGEPAIDAPSAGRTVWYTWVAMQAGTVSFNTQQGIHLRVYRGTELQNLTLIPSRMAPPFADSASGAIPVQANERYYLQIDSEPESPGVFGLSWRSDFLRYPSGTNDSAASASWLAGTRPGSGRVSLKEATVRSNEPELMEGPHKTLWWRWHAPAIGNVIVSARVASGVVPVVGIYQIDPSGAFTLMSKGAERSVAEVRPGHLYYIACAVPPEEEGTLDLFGSTAVTGPLIGPDLENLVENPSFQNLDGLRGWTTSGFVSSVVENGGSPDAFNHLRMPGSPAGISQEISVEAGKLYSVGFSFRLGEGYSRLRVQWDDQTELGTVEGKADWRWTNFLVRASASTAKLAFENLEGPIAIDLITVKAAENPRPEDARAPQSIEFSAVNRVSVESSPFELVAQASSGLPVTFTVQFGPATIEGNLLRVTGPGWVSVKAIQAGSASYYPAEVRQTFTVFRKLQTIQFDSVSPSERTVDLKAVSSSGLPIIFQVVSGPGSISGNFLSIISSGPVTVRAVQPGNEAYEPAEPVLRTFSLRRLPQTIDFEILPQTQPLRPLNLGVRSSTEKAVPPATERFVVTARSSSGLPVTLAVISGPATFSQNLLTVSGLGEVVIEAAQGGDNLFEPTSAQHTLRLGSGETKAQITITFSDGKLFLTWVGEPSTLLVESAPALEGPWMVQLRDNAESRVEIEASGPMRFFRLRR